MEVPLWAALAIVAICVFLLLCIVTFCVVRCFRPENSRGPEWIPDKNGKEQTVRTFFRQSDEASDTKRWLRKNDSQSAPQLATIPAVTVAQ